MTLKTMPKFVKGTVTGQKRKIYCTIFEIFWPKFITKFSKFPTIKINKENYFKKEPSENLKKA
jgi:hypothetical protein